MRSRFMYWLLYRTPVGPALGVLVLLALAAGLVKPLISGAVVGAIIGPSMGWLLGHLWMQAAMMAVLNEIPVFGPAERFHESSLRPLALKKLTHVERLVATPPIPLWSRLLSAEYRRV